MENEMMTVQLEEMEQLFASILMKNGVSEKEAEETAQVFTCNATDGVLSHSVMRFPRLIRQIQLGIVKSGVLPVCISSRMAVQRSDAGFGLGTTSARLSMERACSLAKEYGIGLVALKNANHWMRGGYYGWQAAQQQMIGICWTNTMPNMPPWGALESTIGNNPCVIAIPRKNGKHVVLDSAMSQFSYGKLEETRLKGQQLPVVGGYDKEGFLTTDPQSIEETGRVVPAGFWKGSALSLVLDMAAALLADGNCTCEIPKDTIRESGLSQMFIAINPEFLGEEHSERIANKVIDSIHASKSIKKGGVVRYPGERVIQDRENARLHGVSLSSQAWQAIKDLA